MKSVARRTKSDRVRKIPKGEVRELFGDEARIRWALAYLEYRLGRPLFKPSTP